MSDRHALEMAHACAEHGVTACNECHPMTDTPARMSDERLAEHERFAFDTRDGDEWTGGYECLHALTAERAYSREQDKRIEAALAVLDTEPPWYPDEDARRIVKAAAILRGEK